MDIEKFIAGLKREQAELALNTLLRPADRDAFAYGQACGLVQAYDRMLAILTETKDEDDGKSRQKQPAPKRGNPYLAELDSAPMLPEQMGRR
jgi:hypothetical protein